MSTSIGPVELVVIDFEGNQFNGEVASSLLDLIDKGFIRVIDLAVVIKDADGNADVLEMQDLREDVAQAMKALAGEFSGLMSEEDLMDLVAEVPDNSTSMMVLFEHLWLGDFAKAVRASGGVLTMAQRIPGDIVDAARASLLEAAKTA
ncbi:DUF6325 family protein [Pseudoruegeria sp. HB172150]|uniref:DUF6325 family protein n=1 Tax=Pseudoruegeria sp. HB172150 TaxID=2721164 RepID=UPI001552F239|nr:DUF6325 family protein [Pseudoruegeria sp. HB172150]